MDETDDCESHSLADVADFHRALHEDPPKYLSARDRWTAAKARWRTRVFLWAVDRGKGRQ